MSRPATLRISPSPLTERQIFERLRAGEVPLAPVQIRWTYGPPPKAPGADATAKVRWEGSAFGFVAEIKPRSTPKVFAAALTQLRVYADASGLNPLLVVPYLSPDQLDQLRRESVSGIDLCGNAIVIVPGKILVCISGAPNLFPASVPIRNVYGGATSLVARALLLRPNPSSLNDLEKFIRTRGGALTLTTISKALRTMEDDVLIARRGGSARVLQPDALLDKLQAVYKSPKITRSFVGSTTLSAKDVAKRLTAPGTRTGSSATSASWLFTGQSSTAQYAVMPRENLLRAYCRSLPEALKALDGDVTETDRFPTIELRETDDPTVAFDARVKGPMRFASPVQTYLELMQGDKREQQAAEQVRQVILAETSRLLRGP
jgi:hypothetical protein